MTERTAWYLLAARSLVEAAPFIRALLVCALLYQTDVVVMMVIWILRRGGFLSTEFHLELENRRDIVVVLPTLLRAQAELEGLMTAMRSVARNRYPGRIHVIGCVDGRAETHGLFEALAAWVQQEPVPAGVRLHAVGTPERAGKAIAMDHGVQYMQALVASGTVERFPDVFFNMDADSTLGERALERMVFRLTRRRKLTGARTHIVTSNVVVPLEQCWNGFRALLTMRGCIAMLVAQEYVGAISGGKLNWKLTPTMEVSGALFCMWSEIYLAAPRYAAFMQRLRLIDWLRWWVGFSPPRFADFAGPPLPEAMAGPGDDTWMGWFACCCVFRQGHFSPEFPRTPLHALGRTIYQYFFRPVAYDPLAKVYSRTPTTVRGLFDQRLRWNSSRIQDLLRHAPSLAYHWQAGLPLVAETAVVFMAITLFAASPLAWFGLIGEGHVPPPVPAFAVLAIAGYYASRVSGTVAGLLISESARREWLKLLVLPLAVPYHVVFNTLTLFIGYYRDAFGFGQPTTFAPEATLLRSNLSRVAIAYRLRRALFLAVRSAVHGDVPLGLFWFGWKRTRFTPSGFEGWTTKTRPPPISWPRSSREGHEGHEGHEGE